MVREDLATHPLPAAQATLVARPQARVEQAALRIRVVWGTLLGAGAKTTREEATTPAEAPRPQVVPPSLRIRLPFRTRRTGMQPTIGTAVSQVAPGRIKARPIAVPLTISCSPIQMNKVAASAATPTSAGACQPGPPVTPLPTASPPSTPAPAALAINWNSPGRTQLGTTILRRPCCLPRS